MIRIYLRILNKDSHIHEFNNNLKWLLQSPNKIIEMRKLRGKQRLIWGEKCMFSSIYPAFICTNNSRWWKYLRFFSSIFSTTTTWGELDWEWVAQHYSGSSADVIFAEYENFSLLNIICLQLTQNWLVLLVITVSWSIIQRHLFSFSHYSV